MKAQKTGLCSSDAFLFLFIPFASGLTASCLSGKEVPQIPPFAFPMFLLLLLLSASSVYGKWITALLFFCFGAVSPGCILSGIEIDAATLPLYADGACQFSALFLTAYLSLLGAERLLHAADRRQFSVLSCLRLTLVQALILATAAGLHVLIRR